MPKGPATLVRCGGSMRRLVFAVAVGYNAATQRSMTTMVRGVPGSQQPHANCLQMYPESQRVTASRGGTLSTAHVNKTFQSTVGRSLRLQLRCVCPEGKFFPQQRIFVYEFSPVFQGNSPTALITVSNLQS